MQAAPGVFEKESILARTLKRASSLAYVTGDSPVTFCRVLGCDRSGVAFWGKVVVASLGTYTYGAGALMACVWAGITRAGGPSWACKDCIMSDKGSVPLSSKLLTFLRTRVHILFNSFSCRPERMGRSIKGESGRKLGDSGSPRYFLSSCATCVALEQSNA